jgi:putative toxin-antitoxin system antitoxin component (TIGR02293 family)
MATIAKKTVAVKKKRAALPHSVRQVRRHPAIMSDEPGTARPSNGQTLLWASRLSTMSVIEESKHGIKAKVLKEIQKETGFSGQDLAGYLQINYRTLQRYLQQNTLMSSDVSERALLIAQIAERGREVYGSDERFKLWLNTPTIALGNVKPESLLSTISGMQLVRAELGRIEYGVF